MMCLSLISLPVWYYYYYLYNQATPSQACSVVRIVGSEEMSPWLVPPAGDPSMPGVVAGGTSRAVALQVSQGERTRRPAVISLQRECLAWTCLAGGMWDTHRASHNPNCWRRFIHVSRGCRVGLCQV